MQEEELPQQIDNLLKWFDLPCLDVLRFHIFALVEMDLSLENGSLSLKVRTVSHLAMAKMDLAILKLNRRGKALSTCKLALVKRNLTKARTLWWKTIKKI